MRINFSKKYQSIILIVLIALMLAICGIMTFMISRDKKGTDYEAYDTTLSGYGHDSGTLEYINEDFTVRNSFKSQLPIVILDTNGVEPPINTRFEKTDPDEPTKGIFIPIEGVEPYVEGHITILADSETGINRLTDTPEYTGRIKIKRRGNSSMSYEKAQWLIKLMTESDEEIEEDILGMGEENEWVLNGTMTDKSMLRNYIAYSIASEIMPYTPDGRYCEVLIKNEDKYSYQGLYLMSENIKHGTGRVNLSAYDPDTVINSFLCRRDRYDVDALTLDNYARLNDLSEEYLALLYPSKYRATDDMISYVNKEINNFEETIYSDDPEVYSKYPDIIDVDSFVDYFLINEYFCNYDAGNNSTYFYKDRGGKLTMGPVWDYDGAIDNYKFEALNVETIAFHTKPWFDRLCMDKDFVLKLEKRYLELKRTTLNNDHVMDKIDETVQYLGGAIDREWYRWGHIYRAENIKTSLNDVVLDNGMVLKRNTSSYESEIVRIKSTLREHSKHIYENIRLLERDTSFNTGFESITGWLLLVTALVLTVPPVMAVFRK